MFWAQSGRYHNFLDADLQTDITSVPVSPTTKARMAGSSSNFYTLTQKAKRPDEAWTFMKWLGNGDADNSPQAIYARDTDLMVPHLAANQKYWLSKHPDRNRDSAFNSLKYQFRYPHCPPFGEAYTAANEELAKIFSGTPIDQAIDSAVARASKILTDNPTPDGWGTIWQENKEVISI
jgi:maltose-binding protein MalE